MKLFFIKLDGVLAGHLVAVEAPDEPTVFRYCQRNCGKLWSNIYTEAYYWEIVRKRDPKLKIINRQNPVKLQGE